MKQIVYNASTGETVFVEVEDVEIPVVEELQPPTPEERLTLLENAIVDLMME